MRHDPLGGQPCQRGRSFTGHGGGHRHDRRGCHRGGGGDQIGEAASQRFNDRGQRIISVSMPIQRVSAVVGVLTLESSDIDEIIRAERAALLPFIGVAVLVAFITSVNDDPIASPRDLARKIAGLKPDTDIKVGVWRNGKAETVSVKLARMPKDDQMASLEKGESPAAPAEPGMLEDYGLTVTPSDNGKGVVITDVDPGSDAAERGLQAGDVIVSVNSNAVGSAADIEKAAGEASAAGRKAILLQVERNGANRFVALPVAAG